MKTTRILSCMILMLIGILPGCKKEIIEGPEGAQGPPGPGGSGSVDPNLYAKWQVISGQTDSKYLIIKPNNSFYALDSFALGFKRTNGGTALITGTQIAWNNIHNYTISNDTLWLTNTDGTLMYKKNPNAPDETQWVIQTLALDSIQNPNPLDDGRQDIGFDGGNILWTGRTATDSIYKINPQTHQVTGAVQLFSPHYYTGVTYGSSHIWITSTDMSNNCVIEKINPANGFLVATSPPLTPGGQIPSLALVGQKMWFDNGQGTLQSWDIVSNGVAQEVQLPQQNVTGMEYVNGYLYIVQYSTIYKCQLSPFMAVETYKLPTNTWHYGITHDGANFWIVRYTGMQNESTLIKLNI